MSRVLSARNTWTSPRGSAQAMPDAGTCRSTEHPDPPNVDATKVLYAKGNAKSKRPSTLEGREKRAQVSDYRPIILTTCDLNNLAVSPER